MHVFFCQGRSDKFPFLFTGTLSSKESVIALSETGVFCQCDLFGIECSWYQLKESWDMPSDAQRIDLLKYLVDEGRIDQVLTSHDIHTKHRLVIKTSSCHKRQKLKAPTPHAPIRNRQTRKVANAKGLNRNINPT